MRGLQYEIHINDGDPDARRSDRCLPGATLPAKSDKDHHETIMA